MALFKNLGKVTKILLLLICTCLSGMYTFAATEPYMQKLEGKLKKGDSLFIKDEKFENSSYNWNQIRNNSVLNTVYFSINTQKALSVNKPFRCKADLKIEYWSQPDQQLPITLEHVNLEVNYDTAFGANFQQTAQYDFNNAHKVKVTINDISSQELEELPDIFVLQAGIIVNRDYLPAGDQTIVPFVSFVEDEGPKPSGGFVSLAAITPTANAVTVTWTTAGSQKVDLEWTFVDEESANGAILNQSGAGTSATVLAKMFRNNATRVSLSQNTYTITLVHNQKYLLLRMRTVDESGDTRVEGPWSYKINQGGTEVPGVVILPNTWHQPGLNWQYNATYAEEGKKKEIVNYFDGTLRNRQMVTVNNTEQVAVVQENIYDQFGRPVASILPAPTDNNLLTFYPKFNINTANQAYNYSNVFKGTTGACIGVPDSLKNTSGAARYYSGRNPFINTASYNKYIPDAEGYPLAVTSYTPDNTGRVAVAGGVGLAFQPTASPTGNHTTRNYYGKPEQWELDRLFGNDVGFADHYLKNMVIDPNGQISISYQNSAGKTIATALAGGSADTSLLPLESRPAAIKKNIVLLQPDRFVFDSQALKLTATTTYLASVPDASASFVFSVQQLVKKYSQGSVTICSNCYYNVTVSVKDDCNNTILDLKGLSRGSALANCNVSGNFDSTFNIKLEKVGEYYFTFEMALNRDVINAYTEDFVKNNTNLRTEFQFILDQLKKENFSGCFSECRTCVEALGEKVDFMRSIKIRLIKNGVDTVTNLSAINLWAGALYDSLYSNCQAIRSSCLSPCDELRNEMLQDVSPGGQYALFDSTGQPLETDINVIYQNWRTAFPVKSSSDPDYKANIITREDGSIISPYDSNFTLQQLIRYWKSEWAEKFLNNHPEICALNFCIDNSASKIWDKKVGEIYTNAADIPKIQSGLAYSTTNALWLFAADPFFATGGKGAAYADAFKTDLSNFSKNIMGVNDSRYNVKNLSQYIDYQLYCNDSSGTTNTGSKADFLTRWNSCTPDANCRVPDLQWQMYAGYYLELKQKYYQLVMNESTTYCKGKCIVGGIRSASGTITYPTPSPGNYLVCSDFVGSNGYPFELTVDPYDLNYNIVHLRYIGTAPLAPGLRIVGKVEGMQSRGETTIRTFYYYPGTERLDIYFPEEYRSFEILSLECEGTPDIGPNCSPNYKNKVSRIGSINYSETLPVDSNYYLLPGKDSINKQFRTSCDAYIDQIVNKLTCASATQKATIRSKLTEICMLGSDEYHMLGSSSTLGGKKNSDGDSSFQQVLKRYLTTFTQDCNPWLTDAPTAANVEQQLMTKQIIRTTPDICKRLSDLKTEQQANAPTSTFFNYLVGKYGSAMKLSSAELDALMKGCNNCKYLVDTEITLPVFLDGKAKGCITAAEFWAARANLKTDLNNTLDSTKANYEAVYTNYLNQRWGFTLGFTDYDNYRRLLQSTPGALLCNSPVYSVEKTDPYTCMYNLIDGAVQGGRRLYLQYIDSVKTDFRKQYVNICSGAKNKVTLNTSQQIYHYTLYYYDQAGNLLRTVPPEGVDIIEDQALLDQVDQARRAVYTNCSYNGPLVNTNVDTTLNKLGTALTGTNQSIEFWVYNPDGGAMQVAANAGNKAYLNVCMDGTYLHADIYKLNPVNPGGVDITASNQVDVNISAVAPLDVWTHIVLQGPDLDSSGAISVYVNGVACPVVSNAPALGCGWEITSAATGNASYTQNLAYLKQIRMYKRLMTAAEIAANAKENCMGLAAAYATGLLRDTLTWGRMNVPLAGSPTTLPDGGTVEVQTTSIYPKHRLTTDYAYNSLGAVVQQSSPDANSSYFWYDQLGRLFASRNANQMLGSNVFSYTKYDGQGRIVEVGEKANALNISVPHFVPADSVQLFVASGTNSQITKTVYDAPVLSPASYPQENLRKRVAASIFQQVAGTDEQATYYSYDLLGNVKTLWQKLYGWADTDMKRLDYKYDLVGGKVDALRYQFGKPDQFFYNYEYDAENRIVAALSGVTHNGDNWTVPPRGATNQGTKDAYYIYYKHGPLARTEIGRNAVQGIDYAYTLQGWLKAVNGTGLTPANDMGQDAMSGGARSTFAKDQAAFSLDYYTGDFKPIGGTTATALGLKYVNNVADVTGQNLYNGNISRTTMAMTQFNSGNPVGYSYRYDQLNRLVRMYQHKPAAGATGWDATSRTEDYREEIRYDANGNILAYERKGIASTNIRMDELKYIYPRDADGNLTANTLRHITDNVPDNNYSVDIDNMPVDNYQYDKIGNLIKDTKANISNIGWTVYGKIKNINFTDGSSLLYKYDAAGNRIYKEYTKSGQAAVKTWYVRDPQGNTLGVYGNNSGAQVFWKEQHLYGSSRLGMWLPEMQVSGTPGDAKVLWNQSNRTRYELTNHLGNVLAAISDQPATVYNMTDYTPFGMMQVGRSWNAGGGYRYGFNGKENDNEVKGEGNQQDYGMRVYDPRVGRFLSVDPLTTDFPWYTPYQFAGNKPIWAIDLDGLEEIKATQNYWQFAQDMSKVPATYKSVSGKVVVTTYNLHGWPSNHLYFWDKIIKDHPNFLDQWNIDRVSQDGYSPIFTRQLKEHWEGIGQNTNGLKIGDVLDHHHVNQGRSAVPITRSEHKTIPRQTYKQMLLSKLGNAMSVMSIVSEFVAIKTGNPEALINQFGPHNELGVVYKQPDSGFYYTLTSMEKSDDHISANFDVYSSFRYDDKTHKYVGEGKIGTGSTYQEKSGYSQTIILDNDGKVKSYKTEGVRSPGVI